MYLEQAHCYMIRNDGAIFEGINTMHPYFWIDKAPYNIMIQWFIEHTQNDRVKELLQKQDYTEEEKLFIYEELDTEFCRVRTSAIRGQNCLYPETIFVRLSSDFSLWKDILVNLALDNSHHYKFITIVNDEVIYHNFDPIKINSVDIIDYPIADFITL